MHSTTPRVKILTPARLIRPSGASGSGSTEIRSSGGHSSLGRPGQRRQAHHLRRSSTYPSSKSFQMESTPKQRITTTEKTHLDRDDLQNEPASNISPAVPGYVAVAPSTSTRWGGTDPMANSKSSSVIAKLLGFTLAMITFPIGSYFLTVDMVFRGACSASGLNVALWRDSRYRQAIQLMPELLQR